MLLFVVASLMAYLKPALAEQVRDKRCGARFIVPAGRSLPALQRHHLRRLKPAASTLKRAQQGHYEVRPVLDASAFRHYVDEFNRLYREDIVNAIPDSEAWSWMERNVPLFTCPDRDVERTYYYRWWAFRKHIKQTPVGYVITEFLRPVKHATDYNAISCALGHHLSEGRWVRETRYLDEYLHFWLHGGTNGTLQRHYHKYSGWTAYAAYERWIVDGRTGYLLSLLPALIEDYKAWEQERLLPDGLFWQYDVRDGMEESASGSRTNKNARPSINSYMFGNAWALAAIAALKGDHSLAAEYDAKAAKLRRLVEDQLWDPQSLFFKSRLDTGRLADVREIIGFTPWFFGLPERDRHYERAWRESADPNGFHAPFGLTTTERRSPKFRIATTGDACQWNGPSWPFSTAITLKALANVLNDYSQDTISRREYFDSLLTYTRSQKLKRKDGLTVPWIDENLNPLTGVWWARELQIERGRFTGRGDHYNHSSYTDLIITGLVGLRPRPDDIVTVNPLLPNGVWDWFCLDNISYHGRTLTIIWDRTGNKFGKGKGLRVLANGHVIARAPQLTRISGRLPKKSGKREHHTRVLRKRFLQLVQNHDRQGVAVAKFW